MAFETTPNLNLKKPDTANSVDVWGDELNDTIDTLDSHTHQEAGAIKITPAAMNIDDDVAMGGNNLDAVGVVDFQAVEADDVGETGALYLDDDDDELYWVTTGGTKVKLTNGASINTTLVGGITGDYSSTDADLEYSDSLKAYRMLQDESPDHFAKLEVGDLIVYEPTSGISEAVTIKSPTSLSTGYAIELPDELPDATEPLTMTSAGKVEYAAERGPHGERTLLVPAAMAQVEDGGDAGYREVRGAVNGTAGWGADSAALSQVDFPVPLRVGDRIQSITVYVDESSTGGVTIDGEVYEVDPTTPGKSQKGPTKTSGSTGDPSTFGWTDSDTDFPLTLQDDRLYIVSIELEASANVALVYGLKITYDRP